jgi:signal transduction histidine kinase
VALAAGASVSSHSEQKVTVGGRTVKNFRVPADLRGGAAVVPGLHRSGSMSRDARRLIHEPRAVVVERRRARLRHELAARIAVACLVLALPDLVANGGETESIVRLTGLIALGLNLPYVLAFRTGYALRAQAYLRALVDVALITAGLYGAGGLGAAQYLGIYAIVPVYSAIVFSSLACVLAVLLATLAYLAIALLQVGGVLPFLQPPLPGAWAIAGFNLLVLNLVGVLAAVVARAYRRSQRRLTALYAELERAHEQSLQLNAQLQRTAQRYVLSEVVAGITYEVRDALQGAFGHLWLARRGGPPLPAEALDHLNRVEEACENAMRIMSTALDNARDAEPAREPVAIADVVRRVVDLKAVEARREGVALAADLPAGLQPVLGTSVQLQQVLLNLVVNAQEALRNRPGRREIRITARGEGERATIEVRDTGPGIPPGVLPRVFEPFYTTKPDATGLGLAISAGIAERLGGTLTAENGRAGGAVFRLTLPTTAPSSPTPAT